MKGANSSMYTYPANIETFLVLSWLSQKPHLRADLKQRIKNSGRTPDAAPLLQSLLEEDWRPLGQDGDFGPLCAQLLRPRFNVVDLLVVCWAQEGRCGLYFRADDNPQAAHEAAADAELQRETWSLWEAITRNEPLFMRLEQLCHTWQRSVCYGAQALRSFFPVYTRLVLHHLDAPHFVRELLRTSLEKVDWHVVAAKLLGVGISPCLCSSWTRVDDPDVLVALVEELLTRAGDEIGRSGQILPGQQRDMALFLSGLCRDTAKAMRTACPVDAIVAS